MKKFCQLRIMSLDISAPETIAHVEKAIQWLNMQVNQIKPFVLSATKSVERQSDGKLKILVTLVTEAFAGQNFEFELVYDPAVNAPPALVSRKQLSP